MRRAGGDEGTGEFEGKAFVEAVAAEELGQVLVVLFVDGLIVSPTQGYYFRASVCCRLSLQERRQGTAVVFQLPTRGGTSSRPLHPLRTKKADGGT